MKQPFRFSLLALLIFVTLISIYAASSRWLGLRITSLILIAVSAVVVLALAIRVFFFNR